MYPIYQRYLDFNPEIRGIVSKGVFFTAFNS